MLERVVSGIVLAMVGALVLAAVVGSACGSNGLATTPHEYEMPHAWCYVVMGNGQGVACVPK